MSSFGTGLLKAVAVKIFAVRANVVQVCGKTAEDECKKSHRTSPCARRQISLRAFYTALRSDRLETVSAASDASASFGVLTENEMCMQIQHTHLSCWYLVSELDWCSGRTD